jgi:hypothetical protein
LQEWVVVANHLVGVIENQVTGLVERVLEGDRWRKMLGSKILNVWDFK